MEVALGLDEPAAIAVILVVIAAALPSEKVPEAAVRV